MPAMTDRATSAEMMVFIIVLLLRWVGRASLACAQHVGAFASHQKTPSLTRDEE
jgi:hypothetical protein